MLRRKSAFLIGITLSLVSPLAFAAKHKRKPSAEPPSTTSPSTLPSPTPSSQPSATPPKAANPLTPQEPRDIEALRGELYKLHRSKKARALAQALKALELKHFTEARLLAQPLQKDPLYADSGLYISGLSLRLEAQEQNSKKHFAEALVNAQKAFGLLLKVKAEQPYSGLLKRIPEELAKTELNIAIAQDGLGKNKTAQDTYERAFQRLTAEGLLSFIQPTEFGNYAKLCAKNQSLLCPHWIQKFVMNSPKGSEELLAIGEHLPDSITRAFPAKAVGKVTQTYKAPDLDTAAFDSAMLQYSTGRYKSAIQELMRFNDEFPKSAHRTRARYWLAQSYLQEKDTPKANSIFAEILAENPLNWYGLLSSIALGRTVDTQISGTLPLATSTDPFLHPHEVYRLKRAEQLIAEGAQSLAQEELKNLRPRDTLSEGFLVYLAMLNFEASNHSMGFQILSHLIHRGSTAIQSSFGSRMIFPVVHYEKILSFATLSGLDPILVLSLIKQESAFDPGIASPVGATGLMQLMPTTAVDVEPKVLRASLTEVDTNIRVGTKYLKKLITKYNGNVVYALAAYNAGPGNMDKWLKLSTEKQLGMLDFIESIPFKETREYVGSIIRNYYWYSKRLQGEAPKSLGQFWNSIGPPANPVELPKATQQ